MENRIFKDSSMIHVISLEEATKIEALKESVYLALLNGNTSYYSTDLFSKEGCVFNAFHNLFKFLSKSESELENMLAIFDKKVDFLSRTYIRQPTEESSATRSMQMWNHYNAYSTFVSNLLPTVQYLLVSVEFPDVSAFDTPIMNTVEIISSEGRRIRLHKSHFNESVDCGSGIVFNTALYNIEIKFKRESFLFNELFSMIAGGYVSLIMPNTAGSIGNSIVHIDITEN